MKVYRRLKKVKSNENSFVYKNKNRKLRKVHSNETSFIDYNSKR